mmetsp:Transcript_21438/g.50379  ORF Transcript_21438/g.50379 Transcript_21438/m.50379 type:complete len:575 (-) Transcript_21438:444-2168(-)
MRALSSTVYAITLLLHRSAPIIAFSPSLHHKFYKSSPPTRFTHQRSRLDFSSDVSNDVQKPIDDFIASTLESLEAGTFEGFSLKGPPAPRKRKRKGGQTESDKQAIEERREKLRGKYKQITGRLVLLEARKKRKRTKSDSELYLQTTIKYHLATDVAKNWKVSVQGKENSEVASPREGRNEVELGLRQIFQAGEDGGNLSEWGAHNMDRLDIIGGQLVTSCGTYELQLQPKHKAIFKPTKKNGKGGAKTQAGESNLSHDRKKRAPLSPSSPFFQALGISNSDGKPTKGMASKLRQCQRFVEIVANLVDASPTTPSSVRVVDFGCGRGYLTFSLHSHLVAKFESMDVQTQGLDRRPKLIAEINGIARSLGDEYDGLNFIEGTIGETNVQFLDGNVLPGTSEGALKIVICLHACDTATDDALWFAICHNADLIITAPCCQHELRPQIDAHARENPNHPLGEMLRHSIYRERFTEMTTDALRATLLEIAGYESTNVFEFIGSEHTAKNSMITATKVKSSRSKKRQHAWLQERRSKLIELAQMYGIKRQRLATLMGESLGHDVTSSSTSSRTGMVPLN